MSQIPFPEKREFSLSQDPGDSQHDMGMLPRKRQRRSSRGKQLPLVRYKYVSPMSRSPRLYNFKRHCQLNYGFNQATGVAGSGFDLGFAPTLANLEVFINGTSGSAVAIPNVTDFTNLFDQYRFNNMKIEIFFSTNQTNSGPSYVFPLIHIVNDYNSTNSFALSDINQHPGMRTYQLFPGKKITWNVTPHVRSDVLTSSGITSTSAMQVTRPWIDTSSNNVQFLGTRMYVDNQARSTNIDMGTITFAVTYDLDFKDVK